MSELYTVQKIVGKRNRKGVVEYKVKWLGYKEDDCTWQPLKNLQYVEDMIKAYDKSLTAAADKQEESALGEKRPKEEEVREDLPQEECQNGLDNQEQEDGLGKYQFEEETKNNCFEEDPEQEIMNQFNNQQKSILNQLDQKDIDYDLQFQSISFEDANFENEDSDDKYAPPKKNEQNENINQKNNEKPSQNIAKDTKKCFQQRIQKQEKKSYLQQIEEKTRFIVKAPPKKSSMQPQAPKMGQLNVLQISRSSRTNELIYLTQFGPVISYRRQADMKRYYPDELIKFYESRIEFSQIPKITK